MSFKKLSLVKILRRKNYFGSIKFQCGIFRSEIPNVYQDSRILKIDVPLEKVWTLIWISILTISHRLIGPTFMMFTVIYAIINWEIIGFRKSSPKFTGSIRLHLRFGPTTRLWSKNIFFLKYGFHFRQIWHVEKKTKLSGCLKWDL